MTVAAKFPTGRVGAREAAPTQFRPDLLAEDDTWRRGCPFCPLILQGGKPGLVNHILTVHPDEDIPDE